MIARKSQIIECIFGRHKTQQAEMPYFHYGCSRQKKKHQIRIKEIVFNIKKKTVVALKMTKNINNNNNDNSINKYNNINNINHTNNNNKVFIKFSKQ